MPDEILDEGGRRVRVVRYGEGTYRFQDPDRLVRRTVGDKVITIRNTFISQEEGAARLRFSEDTGSLQDSFGNNVGVGALKMPGRGRVVDYVTAEAKYRPLSNTPEAYRVRENEELIERVHFANPDGTITTSEQSYGYGQQYDPEKGGGRWRKAASNALGLPDNVRLSTSELQKAQVAREFIVKRTTPRE